MEGRNGRYNTELAVLIDSLELALELLGMMDCAGGAYRLRSSADGAGIE